MTMTPSGEQVFEYPETVFTEMMDRPAEES